MNPLPRFKLGYLTLLACCVLANANAATDAASQSEAVKRYPELGKDGSVFHQAFLERVAKYRRESSEALNEANWPMRVAEEVAAGLTTNAKDALKLTRTPGANRGKDASNAPLRFEIRNLDSTRSIDAELKISYAEGEPSTERKHFAPLSVEVYSHEATQKNVSNVEIVSAKFPAKPITTPEAPPKAKEKPEGDYGVPVKGKPGFVTSPFSPDAGLIDVRGFPPGTAIKDPYSGKTFLVP